MPRFSEYFNLGLNQNELDFVDVSNDFDIPVYVDPYAIEIRDDIWASKASEYIRVFFEEVLGELRADNRVRATELMSHLREPKETFLGVSKGRPRGRGVGQGQASQLIRSILNSKAYKTGLLSDLSEMALYVEGIDRDKISDLTTNVIRGLLVDYTQNQCRLLSVDTKPYAGSVIWDAENRRWESRYVNLPYIDDEAVLLVPKYIVRRNLSLDSQEFYNKQITDFLVAETFRAGGALVHLIKGKRKVFKTEVREVYPKSKGLIADIVFKNPELLDTYKEIAKDRGALTVFDDGDDVPTLTVTCRNLAETFDAIPVGARHADAYHKHVLASLTALFYPSLVNPEIEWDINDGRKRIDIVFTNTADVGFFGQRRDDNRMNADLVIVECKNYANDIANPEVDQLIGRFDDVRGRFGIIACRNIDNENLLDRRLRDAAARGQGYIMCLTDSDIKRMLFLKSELKDREVELLLFEKFRNLLR